MSDQPQKSQSRAHHTHARGMCGVRHDNGDLGLIWDSEPLTSSMDSAVAACERLLPGWYWTVYSKCYDHGPRAVLVNPDFRVQIGEPGDTPVMALLVCILKAKQAQEVAA